MLGPGMGLASNNDRESAGNLKFLEAGGAREVKKCSFSRLQQAGGAHFELKDQSPLHFSQTLCPPDGRTMSESLRMA